MNAFFAAIEQRDFPELRGKPVAVTNGLTGTCIITSSYEARAYGIKTGMRMKEALKKCRKLIQRPSRPDVYALVSTQIMRALDDVTPDIEIFSVDEAFLDVTGSQPLFGTPVRMAKMAKRKVWEASGGLLCSVGVAGDKTTAKFAAKLQKPNGLTVIPPWEARERLADVPVTALCGISDGIGGFLAQRGVFKCGDMHKLPISVLGKRFGNLGRRIWLMCQGADPDKIHTDIPAPKSMGHGKVLPPNTKDHDVLLTYLTHMSEKVAGRLRKHQMEGQVFLVGLRTVDGWIGDRFKIKAPTSDGKPILNLCKYVLTSMWKGEGIFQVQITTLDPKPRRQQMDMFEAGDEVRAQLNEVMDRVNAKYGEFTLAPGHLVNRSDMPNVIAPAWKPHGHRQTI
jgi:DNA polymerase-4